MEKENRAFTVDRATLMRICEVAITEGGENYPTTARLASDLHKALVEDVYIQIIS